MVAQPADEPVPRSERPPAAGCSSGAAPGSDKPGEMLDRLLHALVRSPNEAADDVLLEALRLGTESERRGALDALLKRGTGRGLGGILSLYERLPDSLQLEILQNVKALHHALRESGRSDQNGQRLAAMKLIAQGRQGKLAYV